MNFIILPNQLFESKYLDKKNKYIIWEHPHYFDKYSYNKKKILLHKSSMDYYYNYLKNKKFEVIYIKKNSEFNIKSYYLFDPIDKIELPGVYKFIENPNFLVNSELIKKYRAKTDKFFFHAFYMWSKQELDIMPGQKSTDKQNRKTFNKKIKEEKYYGKTAELKDEDEKYIKRNTSYVNKKFSSNYGTTEGFNYPVTHKTAKAWLRYFIKNKLNNFGNYQDVIDKDNNYLFHSLLSTSLNIGLLQPIDIVNLVLETKTDINNTEGFIRQLFWREYQRYTYIYADFDKNYFGFKTTINNKWYNGTLGIEPVDDAIKTGFETGYLHHIQRLMVVGNFMVLSEIKPQDGFRWFMEFSCDSYEWVMHQNVLDMVFFVTGGKTMRRPYISSSNYVIKMSNYDKKSEWTGVWDKKYHEFLKKHKKKLWKFRYYFKNL